MEVLEVSIAIMKPSLELAPSGRFFFEGCFVLLSLVVKLLLALRLPSWLLSLLLLERLSFLARGDVLTAPPASMSLRCSPHAPPGGTAVAVCRWWQWRCTMYRYIPQLLVARRTWWLPPCVRESPALLLLVFLPTCPPAHPSRTVTYRVTFRNATRSQRKALDAGIEGSLWQKCRAALSQTAACTRDGLRGLLLPTGFFPPEFPPAKSSGWSVGWCRWSRCAGVGDRLPVVPSVHQSRLWRRTPLTACCDADRQPPPSS